MRTARRPPHLLLFDHPFGDQLIDGGFNEPRRDPFLAAIPLAIVGDPGTIVDNVPVELSECSRELLQDCVLLSARIIEFAPRTDPASIPRTSDSCSFQAAFEVRG